MKRWSLKGQTPLTWKFLFTRHNLMAGYPRDALVRDIISGKVKSRLYLPEYPERSGPARSDEGEE